MAAQQTEALAILAGNTGNKAARLAQMAKAGFAVPAFTCLPAGAMRAHLAPYEEQIRAVLQRLQGAELTATAAEGALQKLLAPLCLAPVLQAQLAAWAAANGGSAGKFAVRSSALAEDGQAASFAGQFATRLQVAAQDIPAAVVHCWRSAFCAGVLAYAAKQEGGAQPQYMGVLVQRMVQPAVSGVVFSANPRGLLNETVAVQGVGTGDGVVEGRAATTTAYYNRTDAVYYTESQPGAPPFRRELLLKLVAAAEKLEELLGGPIDAEWAGEGDTLWFLQVRPITTLPNAAPLVLDSSNIAESYPGLSLPLTASFAGQVYYGVFRGVARRCLPSEKLVRAEEETLRNMVGCANGRMYYQISNWYTILKYLPLQRKVIPVWQRMMGVKNPQYNPQKTGITPLQRLATYGRIARSAVGIPKKMCRLHEDFLAVQKTFARRFVPGASSGELVALYCEIADALLGKWDITLLNDMYAFVFTGLLQKALAKKGVQNPAEMANALIAPGQHLASMQPITQLAALAKQAGQSKDVLQALQAVKTPGQAAVFLQSGGAFAQKLAAYIEKYGDRSLEELKLESETYRSNPLLLVQTLLHYVKAPPRFVKQGAGQAATGQSADKTGWAATFFARHARTGIAGRETSRMDRSRIFGMVRALFTQLGTNFAAQGWLDAPRDIFYLAAEEVFSAVQNGPPAGGFAPVVQSRRQIYRGYAQLPPYTRLVFAGAIFNKTPQGAQRAPSAQTAASFTGTPCAGGFARGVVRVIHSPADAEGAEGEILVTRTTDPGWVFLLATAGGVISEKGSLLSHTAIIARELNVPLVVDVPGATRWLQTGDEVSVNGKTGQVEVVRRANTNK